MPCYHPVKAFYGRKLESGKREIVFSSSQALSFTPLQLPCGGCVGCRLERARQWSMRCMDEASLHPVNSFVTLTFNERNLPFNRSLDHSLFQRFMKRLRKQCLPDPLPEGNPGIRYFMCGEYGPLHGRPHYHALLFNCGFPDRIYLKTTESGEKIYTSASLDRIWGLGYASVGDVTFGSAAYVARYHLKKVGSVVSDNHYLDKRTGEMLAPEYVRMSNRRGIAAGWFEKWSSDVYPRDVRVIKGVDTLPPKFYDSMYERLNPEGYRRVKLVRAARGWRNRLDNTEDRLRVKEVVKLSQIKTLSTSKEI